MPIVDQESTGWRTSTEGSALRSTFIWPFSPSSMATNSSGYNGFPGGYRDINGYYAGLDWDGYWWTSSNFGIDTAWCRLLNGTMSTVYRDKINKSFGFSVRCLKD
jgi:uncharacterized protein (TIGR02145 family)